MDLLQQISLLKEKLAEKEKSELQLIEEKNKLLKIVKEYNESLANERDFLKEKMIDQDQTIQVLSIMFVYTLCLESSHIRVSSSFHANRNIKRLVTWCNADTDSKV